MSYESSGAGIVISIEGDLQSFVRASGLSLIVQQRK